MPSDLHTHTIFSDGSYSPEELVAMAKNIGLVYFAITDHDTVDGVKYLYENGIYPDKGINIIPGVEFSANNAEKDIHIVGYNIDIYNDALSDMINEISEARWTRFSEIIKNLQEKNFNIREADVLQVAGSSRSIGRFHIARALVKEAPVLILDDSTSALDFATEAKLRRALREEYPDVTIIMIAQRIVSVEDADMIALLEDGTVTACGTHEEMMRISESYRDICRSQIGEGVAS